jgi:TIR domain
MLIASPNDAAADVFVSYSSQDAAQVLGVAEALRAAGVRLWRDGDRLLGGDSYNERIVEAIKRSKVVVLACSPHALVSGNLVA